MRLTFGKRPLRARAVIGFRIGVFLGVALAPAAFAAEGTIGHPAWSNSRASRHPILKTTLVLGALTGGVFLARETARRTFPHEPDKVEHAMAGAIAAEVGTLAAIECFHWGVVPSALFGIFTGAAVGALKEFYDSRTGGDVSRRDAYATALGGGFGAVLATTYAIRF